MPLSFTPEHLARPIPVGLSWLLGTVMECRGRQALFEARRAEALATLRETAIIQSTESSNRIEGVTVDRDRLVPLVRGHVRARDRPEEEIVGYRRALRWIHAGHERIDVTPDTLRELHKKAQWGAVGDAGQWKRIANDIVEIAPDGQTRLRFRTVAPAAAPRRTAELVARYDDVVRNDRLPPLFAEASLILDFLCIHPFRDGNGRVARLLCLLMLYKRGFHVGRYISLERLVEETKDAYYDALYRSSQGWHDAKHDLVPWWSYYLSVVRQAYRELEEKLERAATVPGGKTALVRAAVDELPTEFRTSDVAAASPGVSAELIRRVLRQLRDEGRLRSGTGRSARWRKV